MGELPADLQVRGDQLQQEARDDSSLGAVAAIEVTSILASHPNAEPAVSDGFGRDGTRLGVWRLAAGIAAMAGALASLGAIGTDPRRQSLDGSAATGLGVGIIQVAVGWIATRARHGDPGFVSGVGSFLAVVAGLTIVAMMRPMIVGVLRIRVYADLGVPDAPPS